MPRRALAVSVGLAYAALATALWFYGQYDYDPPGGRQSWISGTGLILVLVLAGAAGAAIGRFAAVLLALAPLALAVPLHVAGKRGDFHDPYLPLENPFLYAGIVVGGALIAGGVAARRAYGAVRRRGIS